MNIYDLSDNFSETDEITDGRQYLIVAGVSSAVSALKAAGIEYDGEIALDSISFNKIETQHDCLYGTLYIPKMLDVAYSRYKIQFFITGSRIVMIDKENFSLNIINRIRRQRSEQVVSVQRFICSFFTQVMSRDTEILSQHENDIMKLEEKVSDGKTDDFISVISPIRKELLILRSYYDELCDIGKELEQDENGLFEKRERKYFGIIFDRADRLMNRTSYLLEYVQQVRDAFQFQVDARQNSNMEFLTVISTIFFPLTLITGWYGMNFDNMPELKSGYPYVICLSIAIVIICIIIFKRKKML